MKHVLCLLILLTSSTAVAETQAGVALGVPLLRETYSEPFGNSSDVYTLSANLTFRTKHLTGLGGEATVYHKGSVAGSLLWDVVRFDTFRAYVKTGALVGRSIVVRSVDRDWDVIAGFGVDLKMDRTSIQFGMVWFLPEPGVVRRRGELVIPVYKEALAGGMFCSGLSWQF